jgi:hypothetical protein
MVRAKKFPSIAAATKYVIKCSVVTVAVPQEIPGIFKSTGRTGRDVAIGQLERKLQRALRPAYNMSKTPGELTAEEKDEPVSEVLKVVSR